MENTPQSVRMLEESEREHLSAFFNLKVCRMFVGLCTLSLGSLALAMAIQTSKTGQDYAAFTAITALATIFGCKTLYLESVSDELGESLKSTVEMKEELSKPGPSAETPQPRS